MKQIKLLVGEEALTLVKRDGYWVALEALHQADAGLIDAIGKNIALRYRI